MHEWWIVLPLHLAHRPHCPRPALENSPSSEDCFVIHEVARRTSRWCVERNFSFLPPRDSRHWKKEKHWSKNQLTPHTETEWTMINSLLSFSLNYKVHESVQRWKESRLMSILLNSLSFDLLSGRGVNRAHWISLENWKFIQRQTSSLAVFVYAIWVIRGAHVWWPR